MLNRFYYDTAQIIIGFQPHKQHSDKEDADKTCRGFRLISVCLAGPDPGFLKRGFKFTKVFFIQSYLSFLKITHERK